jgi:ParB family chromosome partitioning protein
MSKKLAAKAGLIQMPPVGAAADLERPRDIDEGEPKVAKTAPGSMLQFMSAQSAALQEADELRRRLSAYDGASPARRLDPTTIAPSSWANRHEASFATGEFAELKDDIAAAGGNVQPICVRPAAQAGRYEIVFGHRRHRACLELGLPVLAVIEQSSDEQLFVAMDRENRGRQNLSAWEQGRMYQRALDRGLFASMRKLADAVAVDVALISKSVNLARLPDAIVEAFPSPLQIQYRWAQPLGDALQKDPDAVLARARDIKAEGSALTAVEVFKRLLPAPDGLNRSTQYTEIKVGRRRAGSVSRDAKGRVLVTIEKGLVSDEGQQALVALMEEFLAKQAAGGK